MQTVVLLLLLLLLLHVEDQLMRVLRFTQTAAASSSISNAGVGQQQDPRRQQLHYS